jgi:hypothetical protein
MRPVRNAVLAAVAVIASAGSAFGQESGIDWAGGYVGPVAGYSRFDGPVYIPQAGVVVGYNFVRDRIVTGIEGQLRAAFGGPGGTSVGVDASVRAGFLADTAVMFYVTAGGGYMLGGGFPLLYFGGGLELAASRSMSINLELVTGRIGAGPCGRCYAIEAGIIFHVGK